MLSDAENDAYFRTRAWQKQVGAWASQQSQPVETRQALVAAVAREAPAVSTFLMRVQDPPEDPMQISVTVPRPPNWGGYRLRVDAVELWVEGEYRIHDRARWTRSLADGRRDPAAAQTATRLQP